MASAYGYLAQRRRYGGDVETLVRQALERESWTDDAWRVWRESRLASVLKTAATATPYYQALWSDDDRRKAAWSNLGAWPILDKESLRRDPPSFLADGARAERLTLVQTSGTTGTPLSIWHSRQTQREWYSIFEARCRRWYGLTMDDPWAILGGKLVKPVEETSPPYWVWNRPMRQLYMSTYHLAPERLPHYLDALAAHRVRYLLGYTSALYELALAALDSPRRDLRFEVVITNAEPVYPYQREAIEAAFGCPVRETYGMSEFCVGASECEAGRLHLWPDAGVVEILDDQGALGATGTGELVVTSLIKREMPLVRYRVGDRGTITGGDAPCPCGRLLPRIDSIDGRADDVLITPRGERVGRLDPVFKANLPIREAQVIQEAVDRLLVRYVPCDGFTPQHEAAMTQALRARLGEIHIRFESVAQIPRTKNGKFRAVVRLFDSSPVHSQ